MLDILILSFALSMDAFAVSIGLGTKRQSNTKSLALKSAIYFGFFQAIMPFIGYACGIGFKQYVGEYYSFISFILLLFIGIKMIYEACNKNNKETIKNISNKFLLLLAIATSIDAMVAGFTLHLIELNIYVCLSIIGIITFIFSYMGVFIGAKSHAKYEKKAEIFGGTILILIGFKILFENAY